MQEVGPDEGHMYNCHVILSNTGEIKAAYRKVHLFDVDVPNGPILMESRSTAPGREVSCSDFVVPVTLFLKSSAFRVCLSQA